MNSKYLTAAALAVLIPAALIASPEILPKPSTAERLGDMVADTADAAVAASGKSGLKEEAREALRGMIRDKVSDATSFYRDFKELSPSDKQLGIGKGPKGPKIPSKCAETQGCSQCFASANGDVEHLRYSLEKLRAIGVWTDAFTKKSLAFGDDVSAVHGVAGIAWHEERKKIEASYAKFGEAYDGKYEELIGDLEGSLQAVGKCEAKFFGTDDWYDRFGYIYYSFMEDRYRR